MLVAGGAGAVGNAAVQLACWAGAPVVTTVSSPAKAALARAAGAHRVVDHRTQDAVAEILAFAPEGVDIVVEVAPGANSALDIAVAAQGAVVAYYSGGEDEQRPYRCSPRCRRTCAGRASSSTPWRSAVGEKRPPTGGPAAPRAPSRPRPAWSVRPFPPRRVPATSRRS